MTLSQKKICILSEKHWAEVMGGSQYQIKCLLERIIQNKEDFKIYYLARYLKEGFKGSNYELRQVSKPNFYNQYGYFSDTMKLLNLLKEIKPDIIYQRVFGAYTGIAAYYAKLYNCKCIAHISHDYDLISYLPRFLSKSFFPQLIDRRIGKYGLKNMTTIITQSRYQSNLLKSMYQRDDAIVIPNFHPNPIQEVKKEKNLIKIVWVANFKKAKRPEIFLNIAIDLECEKNVEFVMIGRFNPQKPYKSLKRKINMQQNLKYIGELSLEEVNMILSGAHIFVNTSTAEGFPNTFIQSWMNEVPVVSLSVNPDGVFDNQEIGMHCGSYENLLKNLKLLIHNPELREKMGLYAKSYAFEKHSMKNADKIIDLFRNG
jgi:glycosyltransferase involved in cell wall biosynthesis